MSRENVEIVRAALQAFEEGDLERVLRFCDDSIQITQPAELPGVPAHLHGHRGVLESIAVWPEEWDDFQVGVLRIADIGDEVMVTMLNRGRGKESAVEVAAQFTHLFSVRDGKVAVWRIFMREVDALEAARAVE